MTGDVSNGRDYGLCIGTTRNASRCSEIHDRAGEPAPALATCESRSEKSHLVKRSSLDELLPAEDYGDERAHYGPFDEQ